MPPKRICLLTLIIADTVLLPEAEDTIHYLALLYEITQERLALLLAARTSTWSRLQPTALPSSSPSPSSLSSANPATAGSQTSNSPEANPPAAGLSVAELSNPGPAS